MEGETRGWREGKYGGKEGGRRERKEESGATLLINLVCGEKENLKLYNNYLTIKAVSACSNKPKTVHMSEPKFRLKKKIIFFSYYYYPYCYYHYY